MKNQLVFTAIVAIVAAVMVLSGVYVGTSLTRTHETPTVDVGAMRMVIDEPTIAEEEVTKPMATAVIEETVPVEPLPPETPETIAIPGYAQLVMREGDIMQHIELHNPAENPCYFVISIITPDETEIFRSGLMKPGQRTEAIQLKQALAAGTYKDTILRYSCYSLSDKSPMNGADTKFTLEVVQ